MNTKSIILTVQAFEDFRGYLAVPYDQSINFTVRQINQGYCCVTVIFYCTAIRATVRELLGRETVVTGIAVIVVHLISPRYSSWSLSENHCGVQEEPAADILLPRGCSA